MLSGIIIVLLLCLMLVITFQMDNRLDKVDQLSKKHLTMFRVMNNWLQAKQKGKKIESYFEAKDISVIAIYGMHYIGERLYEELVDGKVRVAYGIDKNTEGSNYDLIIYPPDHELPEVDAVIVTPVFYYYEIRRMLSAKMKCPIISVEEVIDWMS